MGIYIMSCVHMILASVLSTGLICQWRSIATPVWSGITLGKKKLLACRLCSRRCGMHSFWSITKYPYQI